MQFISRQTNILGAAVHYLERPGEGTPLILVHGFASGSYTWKELLVHFPLTNRILVLDLPGHGLSGMPRRPPSLPYHAEFMDAFREAAGVKDFFGCGHSMGAAILAVYVLQYPYLLGMLLESPPDDLASLRPIQRVISAPILGDLAMRFYPANKAMLRKHMESSLFDPSWLPEEVVEECWNAFKQGSLRKWIPLALRAPRTAIAWNQIRVPCTVVYGEADQQIRPAFLGRLETIPKVSIHAVQECGHTPHLEHPGEFLVLLEKMLCRL